MSSTPNDPITLEVIESGLQAASEEMFESASSAAAFDRCKRLLARDAALLRACLAPNGANAKSCEPEG